LLNSLPFIYHRQKRYEEALAVCIELKELLYAKKHIQSDFAQLLVVNRSSYLNFFKRIFPEKFDHEMALVDAELREITNDADEVVKAQAMFCIQVNKLHWYMSNNRLPDLLSQSRACAAKFSYIEKHLSPGDAAIVATQIRIGFFLSRKYDEALKWVRKLQGQRYKNIFPSKLYSNYVTQCLILLAGKDAEQLTLLKKKLEYFFKTHNLNEEEVCFKETMHCFSSYCTSRNKTEEAAALNNLLKLSEALGTKPATSYLPGESGLSKWLSAQMQG
jgi:hypothetical protein